MILFGCNGERVKKKKRERERMERRSTKTAMSIDAYY